MEADFPPELEALIKRKLDSGLYYAAGEVVRDALYLMDELDCFRAWRLEELRREVAIGVEQLDRGETVDAGIVFERLKRKAAALRR